MVAAGTGTNGHGNGLKTWPLGTVACAWVGQVTVLLFADKEHEPQPNLVDGKPFWILFLREP